MKVEIRLHLRPKSQTYTLHPRNYKQVLAGAGQDSEIAACSAEEMSLQLQPHGCH